MKTVVLILGLAIANGGASLPKLTHAAEMVTSSGDPIKVSKKGNAYSFQVDMEQQEVDRILQNLPNELPELEEAKRKKNTVVLRFKADTPDDRVSKALLYMATRFGNGEFELEE